jgi:hypothetical protein
MSSRLSSTSPTDPRIRPAQLLHGRQVSRLLHNHDRLLARPDRGRVRRLLAGAVPADRRQGAADRGVLVPQEINEGSGVVRRLYESMAENSELSCLVFCTGTGEMGTLRSVLGACVGPLSGVEWLGVMTDFPVEDTHLCCVTHFVGIQSSGDLSKHVSFADDSITVDGCQCCDIG